MSPATVGWVASRIADHVREHSVGNVQVVLHGGEPLLVGGEYLATCVRRIRQAVGDASTLRFGVQTNGTLLDEEILDLLLDLGVEVGVSVDGLGPAHDRHRHDRRGRGSFSRVARGLRLLGSQRYRSLFAGVLAVIDLRNDPVETYEGLLEFAPPVMDFLLPHGDWDSPPARISEAAPYGRWLARAFDRWYAPVPQETQVRLFGEIMSLLLGGASRIEGIGTSPLGMAIIDTDGGIEGTDLPGGGSAVPAPSGLNVARDPLDRVIDLRGRAGHLGGLARLPEACLSCPIGALCGGGYEAHRSGPLGGRTSASVYCRDIWYVIEHVHQRMACDIAALRATDHRENVG